MRQTPVRRDQRTFVPTIDGPPGVDVAIGPLVRPVAS